MFLRSPLIRTIVEANVLSGKNYRLLQRNKFASSSRAASHKVEEGYVTVNNRKIKYILTGTGAHKLLCFPGAAGTAWTDFEHQILGLDRNKLTIIAWDPPGYGQSRPPDPDFEPGFNVRNADLAFGFSKALNIPYFSVLGWSAGAFTTIGLAAKYPQIINKIVIGGLLTYISDHEVKALQSIRDIDTWPERARSRLVNVYGVEVLRTLYEKWIDTLIRTGQENKGELCHSDEIKKIKSPLLLFHGGKDPLINEAQVNRIIRTIPETEFHCFKDGGHNAHMVFHEEFNSIVMEFLTKPHHNSNIANRRDSK